MYCLLLLIRAIESFSLNSKVEPPDCPKSCMTPRQRQQKQRIVAMSGMPRPLQGLSSTDWSKFSEIMLLNSKHESQSFRTHCSGPHQNQTSEWRRNGPQTDRKRLKDSTFCWFVLIESESNSASARCFWPAQSLTCIWGLGHLLQIKDLWS